MATTTDTLLDAALSYARAGWPVFPLHAPTEQGCSCRKPGCKDVGKHPRTRNGLRDATTDEATIRARWGTWPEANIGIRTGPESGLLIADADADEGLASLDRLQEEHGLLPADTPLVQTGGDGTHAYLKYPATMTIRNSVKTIAPGIDIRAAGGYVVAPPSLHVSGRRYRWLDELRAPAVAPAWFLELIERAARSTNGNGRAHNATDDPNAQRGGNDGGDIPEGQRNETLASIAGRMRWANLTVDEITAALLRVNSKRCKPPLDEDEVRKIARSMSRYAVGDDEEPSANGKHDTPPTGKEQEHAPRAGEPIVAGVRCSDVGNGERLAACVAGRYRAVPGAKQPWHVYASGRWERDERGSIAQEAKRATLDLYGRLADLEDDKERKRLRDHAVRSESQRSLQAAMALATTDPRIATSAAAFDATPGLLNVRNGTVDLTAGRLRSHDPGDLLTKQAPVCFDPTATAPTWERFLAEIIPDADERAWLQRYLGYTALGEPSEQVVAIAHGGGQNGKSTLRDVIQGLMGPYAMGASIETFLSQRHESGGGNATPDLARLPGVRYLFASEPGAGRRLHVGRIKEMSGGESIVARPLYGAPFEFVPQFSLWLSTNKKPVVPGDDPALWRRLRLVPFDVKIPEARRVLGLADRILADEASGVLNWILEGLRLWQQEGRLPVAERIEQATAAYRAESDEIGQFLAQCCEVGETLRVGATELYQAFVRWFGREIGEKPPSQTAFGRDLGERGFDSARDGITWRLGLTLLPDATPERQERAK